MRRHGMLLVVLVLAGGLCGCDFSPATERGEIAGSQPGGAAGAAPSGDFLAQWLEIANQGVQQWDVPRASLLVNQMAQSGPEGLEPMFKLLEDPAGKPEPKVLAKLTPCRGDCSTPPRWVGASTPTTSRMVAATSIACTYWWRTSPRAAMPAGHDTISGSVIPPR